MARDVTVDERVWRAAARHRRGSGERIEARSYVDTPDGPLEVIARCDSHRWTVRAVCAGRVGNGLGVDLGIALLAALEVCGVDAAELYR